MAQSDLPGTAAEWEQQAANHGVKNITIHSGESWSSGSKITTRQFSTLRVLWPKQSMALREVSAQIIGKNKLVLHNESVTGAGAFLNNNIRGWRQYLDSVGISSKDQYNYGIAGDLEMFALVRSSQLVSESYSPDPSSFRDRIGFTPVAMRVRNKKNKPVEPEESPTELKQQRDLEKKLRQLKIDTTESSETEGVEEPKKDKKLKIDVQMPRSGEGAAESRAEDEELVNVFLHLFLDAVTVHYYKPMKMRWTLHRRRFKLVDEKGDEAFTAAVDGYLERLDSKEPLAIVEVKPYLRSMKKDGDITRMQESAEMAAWISQHPPPNLDKERTKKTKTIFKRLLISQDYDEIYLIVAEFDVHYVDYIRGRSNSKLSYLKMKQYGAFSTRDKDAMESLGRIVLGYIKELGD